MRTRGFPVTGKGVRRFSKKGRKEDEVGKGRKEDSIHANQRTAMAPVFTIPRHPDHDPLLDANAGDVTSFVDHLREVCIQYV